MFYIATCPQPRQGDKLRCITMYCQHVRSLKPNTTQMARRVDPGRMPKDRKARWKEKWSIMVRGGVRKAGETRRSHIADGENMWKGRIASISEPSQFLSCRCGQNIQRPEDMNNMDPTVSLD